MAKKKSARSSAKQTDDSKIAVQVRFDRETHEKLSKLAAASQISFNQLATGVLRWAANKGKSGELVRDGCRVALRNQPGCVSFGDETVEWDEYSLEGYRDHYGTEPEQDFAIPGQIVFVLDYTERRVVRED